MNRLSRLEQGARRQPLCVETWALFGGINGGTSKIRGVDEVTAGRAGRDSLADWTSPSSKRRLSAASAKPLFAVRADKGRYVKSGAGERSRVAGA